MTHLAFTAIAIFGAFVGFAMGFFGIGGGVFMVPTLVRVAGLDWEESIGLSLTMMVPTGAIGAWNRARHGEVDFRLGLTVFLGSIPGAWIGRQIVALLGNAAPLEIGSLRIDPLDTGLTFFFFVFLLWMSRRMRMEPASGDAARNASGDSTSRSSHNPPDDSAHDSALHLATESDADSDAGNESEALARNSRGYLPKYAPPPAPEAVLLGVGVGASSAMLGVGGASLFIPIAIQRFRMPVTLVAGTSLFQLPLTAGVGAILYGLSVDVPYIWLVPLLAGSALGVTYGVRVSRRFSNDRLRRILGRLLVLVSGLLAVSWLGSLR